MRHRSLTVATAMLRVVGLAVGRIDTVGVPDRLLNGKVVLQTPCPGSFAVARTEVNLSVARYRSGDR